MSFRQFPTKYIKNTPKQNTNFRKEKDSFLTHHSRKKNHSRFMSERASAFTSKGSLTLEAAFVIPFFFFGMLCLLHLFELASLQTTIRSALQSVAYEIAEESYVLPTVSKESIEGKLIETIGKEYLDQSRIVGGSAGVDCAASDINIYSGIYDLVVRYEVEVPVLMFHLPVRTYEERLRVKGWNGYSPGLAMDAEAEWVYVTEHGLVYHKSLSCTYLELSVRAESTADVSDLRNASGGKYYPCESCREAANSGIVYVTDYGNRYHTSLQCSRLKRNIYAVKLSEIDGMGGCSKCAR